jgi:tetratricopeptide (TPR) repeat protein
VASDPRFISQRLRARFELARVTLYEGKFAEAETQARDAVEQATAASLQTLAANGLIELAVVLQGQRQLDRAETALDRSIELATGQGAVRTGMRAQLQQAGLKNERHEPREAMALAEGPMRFFSSGDSVRQEAQGKNIVSRAYESLDNYAEASRLATEALHLGESIADDGLVATSLESLVGQLTNLGRLPEALAHRERIEQIYRQKTPALLAYDLPNHADLLIQLGRGKDAESQLAEVDRRIAEGAEAFKGRERRVAVLRALLASTELRFADVERLAAAAVGPAGAKSDSTGLLARVLAEHARSQLGRSRAAPADIASWPSEATSPASRRELSYWAASTLLARHEDTTAYSVASEALRALEGRENPELGWRLAAIATLAKQTGPAAQSGASMRDHASASIQSLVLVWGAQADIYFARPDLKALRVRIH